MKKLFTLATAALLFTGAFAQGKDCGKGKGCCKKDGAKKEISKSSAAKSTKAATAASKKA